MKICLFAILVLVSSALLSVNVEAEVPTRHCVKAKGGLWKPVSVRFRKKGGTPMYANAGDTSLRSSANFESLSTFNRCYDAKDILDGRQNVKFHIQVDGADDCKTWHVNSSGSNWTNRTQNYEVKVSLWNVCKTK